MVNKYNAEENIPLYDIYLGTKNCGLVEKSHNCYYCSVRVSPEFSKSSWFQYRHLKRYKILTMAEGYVFSPFGDPFVQIIVPAFVQWFQFNI